MIKVQQIGYSPNQVFFVLVDTTVRQGHAPDAFKDPLLGVLAQLFIERHQPLKVILLYKFQELL